MSRLRALYRVLTILSLTALAVHRGKVRCHENAVVPVLRSAKAVQLYRYLSTNRVGGCHNGLYGNVTFCRLSRCMRSSESVVSFDGKCCRPAETRAVSLDRNRASEVEISFIIAVQNSPIRTSQVILELFVTSSAEAGRVEFVIVDNGSTDDMYPLRQQLGFLYAHFGVEYTLIQHDEPMGYTRANRLGIEAAKGRFVALINSDAFVSPGWLTALKSTLHGRAAAAGPLMLTDNMRISEAGGLVFSDASGANVGRGHSSLELRFLYARAVDYISAACVLVSREVYDSVGGFDTIYGRGYYEDTDLFTKFNAAQRKVVYQPASVVLHEEGNTYGKDSRLKRHLMKQNRFKFFEKWQDYLQKNHCTSTVGANVAAIRHLFPRILWIDDLLPEYDRDSGSVRTFNVLKILIEMGCYVEYQASEKREHGLKYASALRSIGVNANTPGIHENLFNGETACRFDIIVIARKHIFDRYSPVVKGSVCGKTPIIFDTVDVGFLREARDILSARSESTRIRDVLHSIETKPYLARVKQSRDRELSIMRQVDHVIVVSDVEKHVLDSLLRNKVRVSIVSNVHSAQILDGSLSCENRKDALFVGNMNHPPNVQAIKWWFERVLPVLRKRDEHIFLHIVGSNKIEELNKFLRTQNSQSYRLYHSISVEDLMDFHKRVKVLVAPLLSGAGVKGKVLSSFAWGVPVVGTDIALEALGVTDRVHALVANDAESFAKAVGTVMHDCHTWRTLSQNAREHVESRFGLKNTENCLRAILEKYRFHDTTQRRCSLYSNTVAWDNTV